MSGDTVWSMSASSGLMNQFSTVAPFLSDPGFQFLPLGWRAVRQINLRAIHDPAAVVEKLMREIVDYDAEFRREDAIGVAGSASRH
jgi:hypothetical protein